MPPRLGGQSNLQQDLDQPPIRVPASGKLLQAEGRQEKEEEEERKSFNIHASSSAEQFRWSIN